MTFPTKFHQSRAGSGAKRMNPRDAKPLTPLRCLRGSVSILARCERAEADGRTIAGGGVVAREHAGRHGVRFGRERAFCRSDGRRVGKPGGEPEGRREGGRDFAIGRRGAGVGAVVDRRFGDRRADGRATAESMVPHSRRRRRSRCIRKTAKHVPSLMRVRCRRRSRRSR